MVTAKVGSGTAVKIEETTDYPFDESIHFQIEIMDKKIESTEFPFYLRIPEWCSEATIKLTMKFD